MKLIVLLIDGLSADYFAAHRDRLPHLSALASSGAHVRRLGATVPATSMPGRASMLTGVTGAEHGVIGNHVFDGTGFRSAMPQDVAVETLAGQASRQGRDVACVGFALVRPQDAAIFRPPWWMRSWLDATRFGKLPASDAAAIANQTRDPDGRLPPPTASPPSDVGVIHGLAADLAMIDAVAHLAASAAPPDLILSEIATTDVVQHCHGYATAPSHWALAHADMLVGRLLAALERAGRLSDYAIAVASDHGHAPIETAIHPDVVLPEATWETEGASLHVLIENDRHAAKVRERLSAFGVVQHPSDHVPIAHRTRIATFSAPPGHSFEPRPPDGRQPTGKPFYISTHGLRPGDPADDRFCVFHGPGIARSVVDTAPAEQFAATAAALLGVRLPACRAAPLQAVAAPRAGRA
ncbi:MAG: alkaline phosphatase family protein [Pseudomonadota bacterium]